jgi:DNA polymerase-3 subunit delta
MIYFIYGEDSFRGKEKLKEIIEQYKTKHKSGLNLVQINTKEQNFSDFYSNFKINSMFSEKKLIIIKNIFSTKDGLSSGWKEDFIKNIKDLQDIKDIIVIYEDVAVDQRTKIFKTLIKFAKCQEFDYLQPAVLKRWVSQKAKIEPEAVDLLINFVGKDLWQLSNEINKLSNYKKGLVIKKEDVKLLVKPNVETDIFKTIDSFASKNKKQSLMLLHQFLEDGENPLYLLSMITYQFRNLLIVKELMEKQKPYNVIVKQSGLHPFVAQKTYYMCSQFTLLELKKIYQKIFQIDLEIKTGKIDAEIALDLLVASI